MTLAQLKYFYEAARFEHVGKAAKSVNISPSSISAAIASLEAELECLLFDRIGKSILLTDAGKKLKHEAEKVFDQITGIRGVIHGATGQLSGNYRLGASHFIASHFLTPAWSELQNQHSSLIGEICSLHTTHVLRDIASGALDLGLCFSPHPHPELKQVEVYRGKLVIAVRSGHPILKLSGRSAFRELSKLPAAIHKGQPGIDLCESHPVFLQYGVIPQIRFSFDSDACAIERVVSSDSWTLVPDLVAQRFSKRIKVINHPSDWNASYFIALVFRSDREHNSIVHAMTDLMLRSFHKQRKGYF